MRDWSFDSLLGSPFNRPFKGTLGIVSGFLGNL